MSHPQHSRDPSAGSTPPSPIASTFSRNHSRYSSSSSSLATNPDSPSTAPASKTTLHDLVEDPAERDEVFLDDFELLKDEPLCICDTPFCEHRQNQQSQAPYLPTPPEWSPGDDYFSDGEFSVEPYTKRRRSGELATDSLTSRLSRHFPSLKKRLPSHGATASVSTIKLRSGASSRTSSLRLQSTQSVRLSAMPDARNMSPSFSPTRTSVHERSSSPSRPRASSRAVSCAASQTSSRPVEIEMPTTEEDPINREELASTPLLPPMLAEYFHGLSKDVTSPLQSPTVANSITASMSNTPVETPVFPGYQTPPLSAKPSMASLHNARSGRPSFSLSEIPPLTIAEEMDPWAVKLGHANFHITPEPYLPEVCCRQTCRRLQNDWEAAQVQYMRQASRISEHHGATSRIYKLTEAKWKEIDQQWRDFHEKANAGAQATEYSPQFRPLAENQPVPIMPSLNDPQQPFKFPVVEEKDIVGPMVRYAKVQNDRPSKKPAFLRIFTDPASLLSGRTLVNR